MLSDLQRQILCLALERKFVMCKEILAELWGWKGHEQETQKSGIGKAQYASAHASLSRTLTRLWRKSLIEYWKGLTYHRTGISLTPTGEALAYSILAEAKKKQIRG